MWSHDARGSWKTNFIDKILPYSRLELIWSIVGTIWPHFCRFEFKLHFFKRTLWRRPNWRCWSWSSCRKLCVCARVGGWKEGMGEGVEAFPAREPTGMFSTSESRAGMRRNNKAQWRIAEGGTRGPDLDARTCRRRRRGKGFWCRLGWGSQSENRAQGWKRVADERAGLQIKAWNSRDDAPQLHATWTYTPLFCWKKMKNAVKTLL